MRRSRGALKQQVPAKKLSAFINEAVRAKLHPDKTTLDAAYKAARRSCWPSKRRF